MSDPAKLTCFAVMFVVIAFTAVSYLQAGPAPQFCFATDALTCTSPINVNFVTMTTAP
jgi:hypothetical protein